MAARELLRRNSLILAGYLLIALLVIGQNPLRLVDHFIGSDTGDTTEMARNVWYFSYALRNGIPLFDQTLLGYPDGIDGSVLMTVPLQYLPMTLLALFLPLTLAYNLIVILWMGLNGWSMYWLVYDRIRQPVPALFAGLIYLAFPLFQGHLAEGHAGLLVAWAAPLYVWALLRLSESPRWQLRWSLAVGVFFYLTTTGHILQSIYVLLPVTGVFVLLQLWRRNWAAFWRVTIVAAFSALLVLLIVLPAIRSVSQETAYTSVESAVRYSSDLLAPFSPSFLHPLFDQLLAYPRSVLGTNLGEGLGYLGMIAAGLAVIAFLTQPAARWWLLLLLVTRVLAMGPLLKVMDQPVELNLGEYRTYVTLPYAALQNLPGFELARTPARFNFTLAIAFSVMAGYGIHTLTANRQRRSLWFSAGLVVLAALILFEYQSFWGQPLRPASIPAAVAALREDDSIRAVFDVPYEHVLAAKDALYLQTAHQQPLIAGQITRQTPVNPAKLAILQATLDPSLLYEAGADVVIFHHARAAEIDQEQVLRERLTQQLGVPAYQDEQIAIYRVNPPQPLSHAAVLPPQSGSTGDRAQVVLYVPQDQWVDLRYSFAAQDRSVLLLINNRPARFWDISGQTDGTLPLALEAGYHNLTLLLQPPCTRQIDPAFQCRELAYSFEGSVASQELRGGTTYTDGIILRWADLRQSDDTLDVRLYWLLNEARDTRDVRFVHVVDAGGQVVAQRDTPSGQLDASSIYPEIVSLPLADIPPGRYSVRVGWYQLADDGSYRNYLSDGQAFYMLGTFVRDEE